LAAALASGALSAGGALAVSDEEAEPVNDPHQRLTRLPELALAPPVSALAVVVHCPGALDARGGISELVAAWAFDP
jgi:hypothetical protein